MPLLTASCHCGSRSPATAQMFIPPKENEAFGRFLGPFWAESTSPGSVCVHILKEHLLLSLPFLMTSDLELGVPEVSLVSGLERFGGVLTQEVIGALWEGRKLVGWEQF